MTVPANSLQSLEHHWVVDAIGSDDRDRAFSIANAWLVRRTADKQLHLSFVEEVDDLSLLERTALAYGLAAREGIDWLLYPSTDPESLRFRDQAQAGAFRSFQLRQVFPLPEQRKMLIFHVLHLTRVAYAADRWTDFRAEPDRNQC
jgi:hypothetical protein